jgi:hypothetical protein
MSDWQFVAMVAAVAAFCVVRGIFDLIGKRYAWGVLGIVLGLFVLVTPVQTHAVKVDLPVNK